MNKRHFLLFFIFLPMHSAAMHWVSRLALGPAAVGVSAIVATTAYNHFLSDTRQHTKLPISPFEYRWPQEFKWGIADSAYQTEGRHYDGKTSHTNWSELEGTQDACQHCVFPVNDACQRWDRYKEDIQLIKKSGFTRYRFSVDWSKIEPQEGEFDEAAMRHYVNVVDELLAHGIEPVIMLFHHAWPVWFDKKGAFENAENIASFKKFAQYVSRHLPKVANWMTLNEPTGYVMQGYFRGNYPPYKKDLALAGRVLYNMMRAHVSVYKSIKKRDPDCQVGYATVIQPLDPYTSWNPIELAAAKTFDHLMNGVELQYLKTGRFKWGLPLRTYVDEVTPKAAGAVDFIGVNYYSRTLLKMNYGGKSFMTPEKYDHEVSTENNRAIYPEGLYRAIKRCAVLGKPIYIAENGLADGQDRLKQQFIKDHLSQVARALHDGHDIRGYTYWTLMDTYGWHQGYETKYGLYAVDFATQQRLLRPGAQEFINFLRRQRQSY